MFTEVVSAVEGMTELHKMERGERESVDFTGERSLFRRVPAARPVLQWEESPQRALSSWENHGCLVLWIPRLNRNKYYISETYWQTNFSSALIDIKDISLVEPAWYPPYSENALHVFAKKPYQQRGRGEWLSIFPSKKRHFHMKTTEKNDDSILKRNRCMIFAHCSYQSNTVRFAKRTDITQLLKMGSIRHQIMVLLGGNFVSCCWC